AQAGRTVALERIRPRPDLQNNFYFQRDTQLDSFQVGVQLGVTAPLWNRNQGAIISAEASVIRLTRETDRVRNDLSRSLADAFERYESTRGQLALYRDDILPDL